MIQISTNLTELKSDGVLIDSSGTKLESRDRERTGKSPITWKLNSTLLNNSVITTYPVFGTYDIYHRTKPDNIKG